MFGELLEGDTMSVNAGLSLDLFSEGKDASILSVAYPGKAHGDGVRGYIAVLRASSLEEAATHAEALHRGLQQVDMSGSGNVVQAQMILERLNASEHGGLQIANAERAVPGIRAKWEEVKDLVVQTIAQAVEKVKADGRLDKLMELVANVEGNA